MKDGLRFNKNENLCFENLSGVMVLNLSIREYGELPLCLNGRNEKYQNRLFIIDSHDQ